MPKVTLEFNLPEEKEELTLANKAGDYLCVIAEMKNFLRNKLIHEELSDEQYHAYESTRTKLIQLLNEYNCND